MGLGLLLLVSVGKEDLYLTGQPEITYFKVVYKQYTNFSIETIPQFFKTDPDFSRKVTINISKNADLLNQIYLVIDLPSIPPSNHSKLPKGIKKFKWIDNLGLGMIKSISVEIGGIIIDKLNGEFLHIYNQLNLKKSQVKGYNKIVGMTKELNSLSDGKDSYQLQVPINFWFCQDSGLSLPLISLIHNDVKFHVEFESFNKCNIQSPSHYINIKDTICLFKDNEIITQTVNGQTAVGRFIYFDVTTKNLYYDKISNDFQIPITESTKFNISGVDSLFQVSLSTTSLLVQDEDYFRFNTPSLNNSFILANYVFLDNKERWEFINKEIEYLIPTVSILSEKKYYSSNVVFNIDYLNNPVKVIYWRALLLSNYDSNDFFNYSSFPIDITNKKKLINNCKLVLNSIARESITESKFYSNLQKYINKNVSTETGIYLYSFSLYPEEYQPSGTFNFSKIDNAYLQLSLDKNVNYQNPVLVKGYAIQYNVFRIINGLGSLVFYN